MTTGQASSVLHVVHRIGWDQRSGPRRPITLKRQGQPARMQGRPVAAFTEREQAEAFRRDQESLISTDKDPFNHADLLWEMTSMDEDVFADVLLDLGLTPPAKDEDEWREWDEWWQEQWPKLTAEQRASIWRHLDRIQFFQIVEVSLS